MNIPEHRLKVNDRVRLKDVDPFFYGGMSRTGNEGWVRKTTNEKYGYPQVLIEWDKDHWAYNGVADGWAWEGHFDKIEDEVMAEPKQSQTDEEKVRAIAERFVTDLFAALGVRVEQAEAPEEAPDLTDEEEADEEAADAEWGKSLEEAVDILADSSAFILLAIQETQESEESPVIYTPVVISNAQDQELSLIAQSQLSELVTTLHAELIHQTLHHISGTTCPDDE